MLSPEANRSLTACLDSLRIFSIVLSIYLTLCILEHPLVSSVFLQLQSLPYYLPSRDFFITSISYLTLPTVMAGCIFYLMRETSQLRNDIKAVQMSTQARSKSSTAVAMRGATSSAALPFAFVTPPHPDGRGSGVSGGEVVATLAPNNELATKHLQLLTDMFGDPKWIELPSSVPGVKIFDLPNGDPISPMRIYGTVDCNIQRIADFIWSSDFTVKQALSPDLMELRVLEQITDRMKIEYQRMSTPRFIANRDMVYTKSRHDPTPDVTAFTLISCDHANAPANNGCVRATMMAFWRLKKMGDSLTQIEFAVKVDPGGYIPKAVINAYKTGEPVKYLKAIREFLEK